MSRFVVLLSNNNIKYLLKIVETLYQIECLSLRRIHWLIISHWAETVRRTQSLCYHQLRRVVLDLKVPVCSPGLHLLLYSICDSVRCRLALLRSPRCRTRLRHRIYLHFVSLRCQRCRWSCCMVYRYRWMYWCTCQCHSSDTLSSYPLWLCSSCHSLNLVPGFSYNKQNGGLVTQLHTENSCMTTFFMYYNEIISSVIFLAERVSVVSLSTAHDWWGWQWERELTVC